MKTLLLPLHLSFVGLWLGCVLTEVLFERALLGRGRPQEIVLAELHQRVDLFVEVPSFLAVVVTGLLMLPAAGHDALLMSKVTAGLVAVAANAGCVFLVFRRASAAQGGRWEAFEQLDRHQHRWGAVVLLALLFAWAAGLYRFVR